MTGVDLYSYIFEDTGGSSYNILKNITGLQVDDLHSCDINSSYDTILACLKYFGPALVIVRKLHTDFDDYNKFKYEDVPKGKSKEGHAMVLVGIRKDENSQTLLILQNSWRNKLFVEVDQKYLFGSGVLENQVVFVPFFF
jgi:Papain family cysteine protease